MPPSIIAALGRELRRFLRPNNYRVLFAGAAAIALLEQCFNYALGRHPSSMLLAKEPILVLLCVCHFMMREAARWWDIWLAWRAQREERALATTGAPSAPEVTPPATLSVLGPTEVSRTESPEPMPGLDDGYLDDVVAELEAAL